MTTVPDAFEDPLRQYAGRLRREHAEAVCACFNALLKRSGVDLRQNHATVLRLKGLLARLGLRVQVGGGIRTRERIEQYLALGVERVILGTVAVEDFDFTARMARDFPGRIAVGVDMKDGMAATHGWRQVSDLDGVALCRRFASAGVRTVICTDISRDGAQKGTNLALYQKLCAIPGLRVIASGGVGSIAELKALAAMGAWGAILGKALYTGQLSLAEAVQAIRTEEQP